MEGTQAHPALPPAYNVAQEPSGPCAPFADLQIQTVPVAMAAGRAKKGWDALYC
jgi:hypothetical protein